MTSKQLSPLACLKQSALQLEPCHILRLPDHLLVDILGRCQDVYDVCSASRTCRTFLKISGGPVTTLVRRLMSWALHLPPQIFIVELVPGRSRTFPINVPLQNLRLVLGFTDPTSVAEDLARRMQEWLSALKPHQLSVWPDQPLPPTFAIISCIRADRGAVRMALNPAVAVPLMMAQALSYPPALQPTQPPQPFIMSGQAVQQPVNATQQGLSRHIGDAHTQQLQNDVDHVMSEDEVWSELRRARVQVISRRAHALMRHSSLHLCRTGAWPGDLTTSAITNQTLYQPVQGVVDLVKSVQVSITAELDGLLSPYGGSCVPEESVKKLAWHALQLAMAAGWQPAGQDKAPGHHKDKASADLAACIKCMAAAASLHALVAAVENVLGPSLHASPPSFLSHGAQPPSLQQQPPTLSSRSLPLSSIVLACISSSASLEDAIQCCTHLETFPQVLMSIIHDATARNTPSQATTSTKSGSPHTPPASTGRSTIPATATLSALLGHADYAEHGRSEVLRASLTRTSPPRTPSSGSGSLDIGGFWATGAAQNGVHSTAGRRHGVEEEILGSQLNGDAVVGGLDFAPVQSHLVAQLVSQLQQLVMAAVSVAAAPTPRSPSSLSWLAVSRAQETITQVVTRLSRGQAWCPNHQAVAGRWGVVGGSRPSLILPTSPSSSWASAWMACHGVASGGATLYTSSISAPVGGTAWGASKCLEEGDGMGESPKREVFQWHLLRALLLAVDWYLWVLGVSDLSQ